MKAKNACPFCRTHAIVMIKSTPPAAKVYQAECDNCGARGPIYPTKKEAVSGWEFGINGIESRMRKL